MTKLTNEELLDAYDAATVDDYPGADIDKIATLRAEILQRMAEGAAGEVAPQAGYRFNPSEQHIVDEAAKDGASVCEILCNYSYCITQLNKWNVRKFDRSGERLSLYGRMMELHEPDPGSATTAEPRPFTPRCPKCQSGFILLNYNLWVDDGKRSQHKATCQECEYELMLASTPSDFLEFFAAAPAEDAKEKNE